ncbi:hypothetical protein BDQ17DRAFT_1333687 [Cyathus striatus]|nr:hypothetical protein BDQ17DRAFT_1333687 [Cyathus striatus]
MKGQREPGVEESKSAYDMNDSLFVSICVVGAVCVDDEMVVCEDEVKEGESRERLQRTQPPTLQTPNWTREPEEKLNPETGAATLTPSCWSIESEVRMDAEESRKEGTAYSKCSVVFARGIRCEFCLVEVQGKEDGERGSMSLPNIADDDEGLLTSAEGEEEEGGGRTQKCCELFVDVFTFGESKTAVEAILAVVNYRVSIALLTPEHRCAPAFKRNKYVCVGRVDEKMVVVKLKWERVNPGESCGGGGGGRIGFLQRRQDTRTSWRSSLQ